MRCAFPASRRPPRTRHTRAPRDPARPSRLFATCGGRHSGSFSGRARRIHRCIAFQCSSIDDSGFFNTAVLLDDLGLPGNIRPILVALRHEAGYVGAPLLLYALVVIQIELVVDDRECGRIDGRLVSAGDTESAVAVVLRGILRWVRLESVPV